MAYYALTYLSCRVSQGEGLQLAFTKVGESMGVWDAKLRSNLGVEKWPRHAVLAVLWKLAGSVASYCRTEFSLTKSYLRNSGVETLAQCHENIIRAFTQAGDDDSRMAAICSQASRVRTSYRDRLPILAQTVSRS